MPTASATLNFSQLDHEATGSISSLRGRLVQLLELSRRQLQALDRNDLAEFATLLGRREAILKELRPGDNETPTRTSDCVVSAAPTDDTAELLTRLAAHDRYLATQLEEGMRQIGERLTAIRKSRRAGQAYKDSPAPNGINSVR